MAVFESRGTIDVPLESVFEWHTRSGAFERLLPPWEDVRVLRREGDLRSGGTLCLEIRKGPLSIHWTVRHTEYEEGLGFTDMQIQGPFQEWRHQHGFTREGDSTIVTDRIEYRLPLGRVGKKMAGSWTANSLTRAFRFRIRRLRNDLERHLNYQNRPLGRIIISGASGLIGRALTAFLRSGGYRVDTLVRRHPIDFEHEIFWNPNEGKIDSKSLEGADTVIHLAGENLVGRWTHEKKKRILESRVRGTSLLSNTLATLERKPRVFVSVSGVGYYGNRNDPAMTEDQKPGEGFLSRVCIEWERAARPAEEAGIRVVHPRLGLVLSARGGALPMMLPPFRMGLGGPIGNGIQIMSWIALDDVLGLIQFLIHHEGISGPVNATAPGSVTNRDFSKTLARVIRRPMLFTIPEPIIRLFFGEMGRETLLAGVQAVPARAQESGFRFLYPELEAALRAELGISNPEDEP